MTAKPRVRRLAFERLESKSFPSSLLVLLVASADECAAPREVGAVDIGAQDTFASVDWHESAVGSKWQCEHSPNQILRFVAENTAANREELETYQMPTKEQCDGTDTMMKLDDGELRAMVLLGDDSEQFDSEQFEMA